MSKIFDALRKSEGTRTLNMASLPEPPRPRETGPVPVPAGEPTPVEPEPVRPAELVVGEYGLDLPLEFVRELGTLRGTLDQLLPGRTQRTVLVGGAVTGEGASTVAAAFSRLLAEDRSINVALVDADLRGDGGRRLPAADPGSGLPAVLTGDLSIERALVGTTLPNLVVLPGGVPVESPLRLLTSDTLSGPLDYLRRHFHFVIIDGAPLLEAPESINLAGQVDGMMLVVRAARTKREVVQRAIDTVEKFQGRILGAILNRQQYVIPEFIYRRI